MSEWVLQLVRSLIHYLFSYYSLQEIEKVNIRHAYRSIQLKETLHICECHSEIGNIEHMKRTNSNFGNNES